MTNAHRVLGALIVALLAGACDDEAPTRRAVPEIGLAARELDFGAVHVGDQSERPLAVLSLSAAPLRLTSVAVQGAGFELARPVAEEAAEIVVRFQPQAAGPAAGTLVVENTSENEPRVEVALRGEGKPTPLCDDHQPCTAEVFDFQSEQCVFAPRFGPCDDLNACTTGDTCFDAVCRGEGLACADDVECTRDVCDPQRGCLHLPDHAACADADPCTDDVCDGVDGCSNPDSPDGTLCGAVESCTSVHVCVLGFCTELSVPDGFPCKDGDMCTVGDTCQQGVCRGTRLPSAPQLQHELVTFGAPGSKMAALPGGTLVFADVPSPARDGSSVRVSVVGTASGKLELLHSELRPSEESFFQLSAVDATHFLAVHEGIAPTDPKVLQAYEIGVDGALRSMSSLPLTGTGEVTVVWPAAYQTVSVPPQGPLQETFVGVETIDLRNLDALAPAGTISCPMCCGGLGGHAGARRLLYGICAAIDRIGSIDISDPFNPRDLGIFVEGAFAFSVGPRAAVVFWTGDANDQLALYDPQTFEERSSLALPGGVTARFVQENDTLWVLSRISGPAPQGLWTLGRYTLADPRAPVLVATYPLGSSCPSAGLEAADDLLILRRGALPVRQIFQIGASLAPLTGRAHGANRAIAAHEGQLFAFDAHGARRIATGANAGPPAFEAGAMAGAWGNVVRLPGSTALAQVAPSDRASLDPCVSWPPTDSSQLDPSLGLSPGEVLPWTDATNLTEPIANLTMPLSSPGGRFWRSRKGVAYALAEGLPGGRPAQLERYVQTDPNAPPSPGSGPFVLEGTSSWVKVLSRIQRAAMALDDAGRVAVAIELATATDLVVARGPVPNPIASTALEWAGPPTPLSVALSGDTVAVLQGAVRLYALDEVLGTLDAVPNGELVVPEATHLLGFDGRTLLVATGAPAIVFVDSRARPPAIIGQIALEQLPLAAEIVSDQLVVGSNNGVSFISPPCPPP